jgi:hypothetical protein
MVAKKALIQWLPKEQGGRSTGPPIGPQYSAPAKFLAHVEMWLVEDWDLVLERVDYFGGPEKWLANVHFRVAEAPHQWLEDGASFELYEGKRCVARGQIETTVA